MEFQLQMVADSPKRPRTRYLVLTSDVAPEWKQYVEMQRMLNDQNPIFVLPRQSESAGNKRTPVRLFLTF
jgi:hypothetical protein